MPQPIERQYFLAGHISRSHGVDGTVLIVPVLEAADPTLFNNIELVRLQNERGDLIPARIDSGRVEEKEDRISFFVKFEHISTRNEAENAGGSPVFIDKDKVENIIAESHSWIAFDVFDEQNERIGQIEDVVENPAHLILNVSIGSGSLLVPCVDEYIVETDEENEIIRCRNLDRLEALKNGAN